MEMGREEALLIQMSQSRRIISGINTATSAGEGRCIQLFPCSEEERKKLCLQQKPWGDRMEPARDCPAGRAPWLRSPAPRCPWHRAGLD